MDRDEIERRVREWIQRAAPGEESLGEHSAHAARTWARLDRVDAVRRDGDRTVVRFTWSQHRESEFAPAEDDDDPTCIARETTELVFGPDGEVGPPGHATPR